MAPPAVGFVAALTVVLLVLLLVPL